MTWPGGQSITLPSVMQHPVELLEVMPHVFIATNCLLRGGSEGHNESAVIKLSAFCNYKTPV